MASARESERNASEDDLHEPSSKRPRLQDDEVPQEAPPAAKDWKDSMRLPHPDITRPTKRQLRFLKKECREAALPLWPVRAARAALGPRPVLLGEG